MAKPKVLPTAEELSEVHDADHAVDAASCGDTESFGEIVERPMRRRAFLNNAIALSAVLAAMTWMKPDEARADDDDDDDDDDK